MGWRGQLATISALQHVLEFSDIGKKRRSLLNQTTTHFHSSLLAVSLQPKNIFPHHCSSEPKRWGTIIMTRSQGQTYPPWHLSSLKASGNYHPLKQEIPEMWTVFFKKGTSLCSSWNSYWLVSLDVPNPSAVIRIKTEPLHPPLVKHWIVL